MKTKKHILLLLAVCTLCVSVMAAGFVGTNRKTARAEGSAITGATLTLGNSIALRYYADASEGKTLTMRFTMNGTESDPVEAKVGEDNQVYFDFEVAPQCMGDEVTAVLYAGEDKLAEKTYSVEQYCKTKIADEESDDELKSLCSDVLAYGAAAQIYKDYKTDSLVNAENAGVPTDFEQIEESDLNLTEAINENTGFTAANCYFDGKNEIYFLFKTDDFDNLAYEVKKDGEEFDYTVKEQGEGVYAVVADAYAVDFDAVYTVVLKKGESTQTATYSLKSYVYYWQDDTTEEGGETLSPMANLARSLWNYGESSQKWYYIPQIAATEETVTVKAGETYAIPQLTATNRAGETLNTTVYVNGEENGDNYAIFYENGTILYSAESHGVISVSEVKVNVDYDGVNLVDTHYLDTAADRFYGIYGATFYYNVGGTQSIGRFTGKQVYDERIDIGISVTSFVGSMSFNLRGGSETEKGLSIKVENSGGGRVQIYNGSELLTSTDDTMPDTKSNTDYWNGILQKPFNLSVQVTDKKDESGNVTAVVVKAAIGDLSVTGDNGYEIAVNDGNRATLTSKGWFFIEGGANTDWMKANAYVHSIYLNTPNYSQNLLLSGWDTKNGNYPSNENGLIYADDHDDTTDNVLDPSTEHQIGERNYITYGLYNAAIKDQKIKITVKAAFTANDEFGVYFRGNNNVHGTDWMWVNVGMYVSFSANEGVNIAVGELSSPNESDRGIIKTYDNATVKSILGKTISELFADGVTLELQATDVTDGSGNVTGANVKIWINEILINEGGYTLENDSNNYVISAGKLMLGGHRSDTVGYISGVYIED